MPSLRSLILLVLTTAVVAPVPLAAQELPAGMTPEQALQLLGQRPDLARTIQGRLRQSGMSATDIQSRLRSAGLPAGMLDQYLGSDTLGLPQPNQGVLKAVSLLGVDIFAVEDSFAQIRRIDSLRQQLERDSVRLDSIIQRDARDRYRRDLPLFGLDVFRQATTQFTPLVAGPVDDSYQLGPGDITVLILTGQVEAAYPLEVTREGFIFIPDVGQIFVNNLTLGQLREVLYDRLGRRYSGVTRSPNAPARFDVTVARVRAVTVRVAGEVARPGSYQVAATSGVLSALYAAGGLTERGSFRSVEVLRGGTRVGTFDLYDYLLRGQTPTGVRLNAGDVVFVPVRSARVKIAGAVIRPAVYEMKPDETVGDLIRAAGGLLPDAAVTSATIDRVLPPEARTEPGRNRTVLSVDLRGELSGAGGGTLLAPGDSVHVYRVLGDRTESVTIAGSVWQPGTYRRTPDMGLSDLIRLAGGLRPETYQGRAQILRVRPDLTRELIGAALDGGDDPALRELDQVTVFARTDFRPQRYIGIYGAVRTPGRIAFADSMTLRDAVLLAGGVTDAADLTEAEVSRLVLDGGGNGDSIAVVLRVPLDSSVVVDATGYVSRPTGAGAPLVRLAPYDNVLVLRQPGWEEPREVSLTGEVRSPGRYTLRSKSERLSDLLARAGGLTPQGYVNGIRFFRAAQIRGAPADTSIRSRPTRIGVDLPRVLRDPNYRDNLVLADGDSIHLPTFVPVVRVEGAVNAPSDVTYRPGAGVSYYVEAAGGYTRLADKKNTFVQQPNGIVGRGGEPGPGAVVVVPHQERVNEPFNWIQLAGVIATVLSSVSTVVIVALTR